MGKNEVLLIDDELGGWYMDYYVKAFRDRGMQVTACASVEEVDALMAAEQGFSLVGIDLLMPPGRFSPSSTGNGLKTGLAIYQEVKDVWPNAKFFFLTNLSGADIVEEARQYAPVFEKIDFTPEKLAVEVEKIGKAV